MACTNAESAQLVSCNEVGEPAAGRHSRLSRLLAAAPVLASFLSTSAAGGESTFWLDLLPNTIETIKAMATEGDRLAKRSVCDEEKSAGPSAVKAPAKCVFNTRTKALVVQSLQPPGVPTASGGGTDISPDGTCVVGHQDNGFFTRFHAFRWTQATGPVDLGTLDPPNNANRSSSATAVSSDCTVVTGFSDVSGGFIQHAFRWTSTTGMVDLGVPAGASHSSRAFGVSGDGTVIVGDAEFVDASAFSGFRNGAFRWTGGTFQALGALEPAFPSVATAVSGDGTVVVGQGGISITVGNSSINGSRAFRWTQSQGMQPIGPLPGDTHAAATAVSDNGNIVVGTSSSGPLTFGSLDNVGSGAFRWTEATGTKDLRQLLVDAGIDMTGITIVAVTGMSRDGQFIAGKATTPQTEPGERTAFIAHYCDSAIGAACASFGALRADFDGDTRGDILWRNASTGDDAIWQMSGASVAASALIAGVSDTNWRMIASGDFNANGKADILWRNVATGDNAIWLMDGFALSSSALILAVPDLTWQIAAVGDFNADGTADILWRNSVTGDNAIWLMDGVNVASSALITRVADLNWGIARVGDFDNDGRADILWRNTSTGENAIWLMNGTALVASQLIASVPTSWAIAGVADYDANGKADILWRNATSGDNAIWLIDGLTIASAALIPSVPDPAWTIVGTGDHDGNDKADILWRNTTTGQNAIWSMDGVTLTSSALIPSVADANWRIVGQ